MNYYHSLHYDHDDIIKFKRIPKYLFCSFSISLQTQSMTFIYNLNVLFIIYIFKLYISRCSLVSEETFLLISDISLFIVDCLLLLLYIVISSVVFTTTCISNHTEKVSNIMRRLFSKIRKAYSMVKRFSPEWKVSTGVKVYTRAKMRYRQCIEIFSTQ